LFFQKNPDDIATPPMKHATPETQSLSDLDTKDPEERVRLFFWDGREI
jgi:hypothetical protein